MHQTAFQKMNQFHEIFFRDQKFESELRCLDVGSAQYDLSTPTYKKIFCLPQFEYVGLDIQRSPNVDIVPKNSYSWDELSNNSFDLVISGQTLEHVPYFWKTAQEMYRVLKPFGLMVLCVPSCGPEHKSASTSTRDCWRFLEDGLLSLAEYLNAKPLTLFTDWNRAIWGDSFMVLTKSKMVQELSSYEKGEIERLLARGNELKQLFLETKQENPDKLPHRTKEALKLLVGPKNLELIRRVRRNVIN